MSRQKAVADRNQYVVKSNDLIRKTRYNLTTQQQKIVLFAISKIKPSGRNKTLLFCYMWHLQFSINVK